MIQTGNGTADKTRDGSTRKDRWWRKPTNRGDEEVGEKTTRDQTNYDQRKWGTAIGSTRERDNGCYTQ